MRFQDFTIAAGGIRSRRTQDTDKLEPLAVALCSRILEQLQRLGGWIGHGVSGMPVFEVSLNAPAELIAMMGESVEAPDRLFCVRSGGQTSPFQFNVVLPADPSPVDARVCATILGLSLATADEPTPHDLSVINEILDARPCMATTILPIGRMDFQTVSIAADFSTCFAAAMLLAAPMPHPASRP